MEEPLGVIGVFFCLSPPLGMSMDKVLRRQDRCFVDCLRLHVADRFRLNVKDASFLVIDPDDSVRRHEMILLGQSRSFDESLAGSYITGDPCRRGLRCAAQTRLSAYDSPRSATSSGRHFGVRPQPVTPDADHDSGLMLALGRTKNPDLGPPGFVFRMRR